MSVLRGLRARFSLVGELTRFVFSGGRWWLAPLLFAFALLALLVALAESPVLAPFIYALF